jgi:hypothetical protein
VESVVVPLPATQPVPIEALRQAPTWEDPNPPGAYGLPKRVPAEPDVPDVPPEAEESADAEAPDLSRIASYLRDEDEDADPVRPEGFDIPAVLAAVRDVSGVREAQLRTNPGGVHTLRLELADDADPGQVSREVARLLKIRMGLAAEPNEAGPRVAHQAPTGTLHPIREARRRAATTTRRADERRGDEPGRALLGGGRLTASSPTEPDPDAPTPRPLPGGAGGPRVVIDQVEVSTQGTDAVVEVRLLADGTPSFGVASGPAFDGYVLRLAAVAAANAVDELLCEPDGTARGRCFVEHATVVPFGNCEVAVVVLLLVCGGWVEQLAGSAVVGADPRQAVVRATLSAVNRRLEALLP